MGEHHAARGRRHINDAGTNYARSSVVQRAPPTSGYPASSCEAAWNLPIA